MPNLEALVTSFGYVGITALIFAESGFFLGFFLPGDSLLITAGLLAAAGYFNIYILVSFAVAAAILGDNLGYATGRRFGPKIFYKEQSLLFKKKYIVHTEDFFKKYGAWAIVLSRFTPIIRTFTPIMAGVGNMKYRTFALFNIIGGVLWAGGLLAISYIAGNYIPHLNSYIDYIVIIVIVLSVLPIFYKYYTSKP